MSQNPTQIVHNYSHHHSQLNVSVCNLILVRNATRNQGGEGFPHQSSPKGCTRRQDKEERKQHQVQDPLLALSLHARCLRQGEGREVEAIFATRSPSQGGQVNWMTTRMQPNP